MRNYKPLDSMSQGAREKYQAKRRRINGKDKRWDTEQRRNARRHGADNWPLHPDRFEPIAADGEATDAGVYDLFQTYSDALGTRTLAKPEGIGLADYVEHMLRQHRAVRKTNGKRSSAIFFANGYDFEKMILQERALTDSQRVMLAKQKSRGYKAVIQQGQETLEVDVPALSMYVYIGKKSGKFMPYNPHTKKVWGHSSFMDIHTFFNSSFLKALEKFKKLWTETEKNTYEEMYALIKEGKEARENWAAHRFTDEMRRKYNEAELRLTTWLFDCVRKLCLEVGIYPASLAGPAPLARALIRKYGVERHIKPAEYDDVAYQEGEWNMVCRRAFSAGWIELTMQGVVKKWVEYDITSAYPYQMTLLPCCAHGHAYHMQPFEIKDMCKPGVQYPRYGIFRVRWRCKDMLRFGPFAVRGNNGAIYRPLSGETWAYASEVQAFTDVGNGELQILDGWIWVPECGHEHPFKEMVEETFAQRQQLLSIGNPAEYILKLALNSLYGIMAQCAGSKRIIDENGKTVGYKTPKFSNLFAAGFITAGTRAELYRAACVDPNGVIGMATDALHVLETVAELDTGCPEEKTLGRFERRTIDEETLFIGAGIRFEKSGKGDKLRGYPYSPEIAKQFFAAWEQGEETLTLKNRRFLNITRATTKIGENEYVISEQAGKFVEEERICELGENILASKRDIWTDDGTRYESIPGTHYIPPYKDMAMHGFKPFIYRRPIDPGIVLLQDEEEVKPDG